MGSPFHSTRTKRPSSAADGSPWEAQCASGVSPARLDQSSKEMLEQKGAHTPSCGSSRRATAMRSGVTVQSWPEYRCSLPSGLSSRSMIMLSIRPMPSRSASRRVLSGVRVKAAPPSKTECMFRAVAASSSAATSSTCGGTNFPEARRHAYQSRKATSFHGSESDRHTPPIPVST
eukprot:scaffold6667_cov111-Isochrysis_galbana.AAC.3